MGFVLWALTMYIIYVISVVLGDGMRLGCSYWLPTWWLGKNAATGRSREVPGKRTTGFNWLSFRNALLRR
jgi:hypothetical protein